MKSTQRNKPPEKTWRIHNRLKQRRRRRASDVPLLGIPIQQYLELMQATAEQLNSGVTPQPDEASV